jgi:serine/threonine protein kinase
MNSLSPNDDRGMDPALEEAAGELQTFSESLDQADAQTIALLRTPTELDTAVAPRVTRLIDRLGRLGAILGSLDADASLPTTLPSGIAALPATESADTFPKVPGFRLLSLLGKGGMGKVYLAEETALSRRVALKIIGGGMAANSASHARFLREARAMAAVVHDNVMPVLRVGECDAGLYFTMPLLDGQSLADRLDKCDGALPPDEALNIFLQIAEGLQAIHGQGLVHRDIKPSNIWLETVARTSGAAPMRRVRILDFGVALDVAPPERTQTLNVLGTPGFMSPEQAAGGTVDARSDLFSLGAVGYRMWTGKPAFSGDTLFALLTDLALHDPPAANSVDARVPLAISQLLERLVEKDRAGRPATAADVLTAVNGSVAPTAPSWRDRLRIFAPALLVLAVAAAITITVINQKGQRASVTVPDGTHAEVLPDGNVRVHLPESSKSANSKFPPLDPIWSEQFRKFTVAKQRMELAAELVRRNPRYDGLVYHSDEKPLEKLTNLGIFTDRVRDITPLSAATAITNLQMVPSTWERGGKGQLVSLDAVRDLNLQFLDVTGNPELSDLSPLEGMQINWLNLSHTGVRDLEALRNVELTGGLLIENTAVNDLSPIADKPLVEVHCAGSKVQDLKPLAGKKLIILTMPAGATPWSVAADMPLVKLKFTPDEQHDVTLFRRMKTLKEINGLSAEEFWREYDERRK